MSPNDREVKAGSSAAGIGKSNQVRSRTIGVQAIVSNLDGTQLARSLEYLDNTAMWSKRLGKATTVDVAYGDCSPTPILDDSMLVELRSQFENIEKISYTFFGENIGPAAGHNRLGNVAYNDYLMTLDPTALAAPNLLSEMLDALDRPEVGLVESRQLPIEHPKYFDINSGETSWACSACALMPLSLFRNLNGFDYATFPWWGYDVDFSWRLRLLGYRVIHQSSAAIYRDERVDTSGARLSSSDQKYFAEEAALLLPYKFSRFDITQERLENYRRSGDALLQVAASNFERRRKTDALPIPIDADHTVAQFCGR
jgi:GT2 family glycosyltransferase